MQFSSSLAFFAALRIAAVRAGTDKTEVPTVLVTRFPTDVPTDPPTPNPVRVTVPLRAYPLARASRSMA